MPLALEASGRDADTTERIDADCWVRPGVPRTRRGNTLHVYALAPISYIASHATAAHGDQPPPKGMARLPWPQQGSRSDPETGYTQAEWTLRENGIHRVDMIIVFIVLGGAMFLFATELLPIDLTALLIPGVLIATGLLSPEQAVAGFSNPAPITVAAVLVLSAGLIRTGAIATLGSRMTTLGGRSELSQMAVILIVVGVVSAFINNTAAVAMSIPIVLGVARDKGISPSRLLIPVSFAGILGGLCTYIGTSTNIIVGALLESHGHPRFRMFEFTPLGVLFLACGLFYLLAIGRKRLPRRRGSQEGLTEDYHLNEYLTELVIRADSRLVGKTVRRSKLANSRDIEVLDIRRDGQRLGPLQNEMTLRAGDLLIVKGNINNIMTVRQAEGLEIHPEVKLSDQDLESPDITLAEGVIAARSRLIDRTLVESDFRKRFQATVLAIRRHGGDIRDKLASVRLQFGDTLLIQGRRDRLQSLREGSDFMLFMEETSMPRYRKRKMTAAVAIFLGVVGLAALTATPIMVAALLGALAMVLSRCLTIQEGYQAIEWRIIMLIGGTLSLGKALETTGGAQLLAEHLIALVGPFGPQAVLAALYLLTMLVTEMMSNNATAALMTPIALSVAAGLDVDVRPFAFTVAFAASASFLSPIGYQTNTLVYGPGGYKFTDFFRVGWPISLMIWVLASLLIPVLWPF